MSQSKHKTLIRVLLWWVALLSVCQAALLVLFFTKGHFGKNGDAQERSVDTQFGSNPSSENPSSQDKAKMLTFEATGVQANNTITWYASNPNYGPVDDGDSGDLIVQKDGQFFVCLRVTLKNSTCRSQDTCPQIEVTLKEVTGKHEDILTGWINNKTLSTGLLCKMKKLLKDNKLRVEIKPPNREKVHLNKNQSHCSLDIFYMPN
ncbi:uncharacterized protein LOC129408687 [Boleophthalmus pectinirostris]|uniref:uncharacterized protein LOC129408687 n=1 Tax=Boleophthalmus pectinirostris TaxID=150288 RepID=UPI002432325D|nr:uncharacterized protein LOC129408687 [Boleophthalmus pectinirostris]